MKKELSEYEKELLGDDDEDDQNEEEDGLVNLGSGAVADADANGAARSRVASGVSGPVSDKTPKYVADGEDNNDAGDAAQATETGVSKGAGATTDAGCGSVVVSKSASSAASRAQPDQVVNLDAED